jgi:hypothetical protein
MAVVRISDSLRDEICSNGRRIFEDRRTKVISSYSPDIGDKFYHLLYSKYPELQTLPAGFFETSGSISIVSFCGIGVNRDFRLTRERPFPDKTKLPGIDSGYRCNMLSYKITTPPSTPEEQEIYDEISRVETQLTQLNNDSNELRNFLMTLLAAHSTLSSALKAWPPLWDYVPEDAKQRHLKVPAKQEKPPAPSIDPEMLNRMTAMTVVAKLVK